MEHLSLNQELEFKAVLALRSIWAAWAMGFLMIGLSASFAQAQATRPLSVQTNESIVYHGKLVKPDGKVVEGSVNVTVEIFSPEPELCLLWKETQTVTTVKGAFALELGHNHNRVSSGPGSAYDGASSFRDVFLNASTAPVTSSECASGHSSYTPAPNDDRLMTATFDVGETVVSADSIPIKSVPFAKQAAEVGGFGPNNLMKISDGGSTIQFTPAEVQSLKDLLGGSIDWDLGGQQLTNVADPVAGTDATNKQWVIDYVAANGGGGGGGGSVEAVTVGGLPLSVGGSTASPSISIAQAGSGVAGYLSAADWALFNSKQPAGSYLTGIPANSVVTGSVNDGSLAPNDLNFAGSMTTNTGLVVRDGTQFHSKSCSGNETLIWTVANGWVCSALVLSESDPQVGANSTNALSKWDGSALVASGVYESGGNVGVGTASPSYLFEARKDQNVPTYSATTNATDGTNSGAVHLLTAASNNLSIGLRAPAHILGPQGYLYTADAIPIAFWNSAAERMRIDPNGNVGIGTSTPGQKLEVSGTVKATAFEGNGAGLTNITATNLSGTLAVGGGGTGATSLTSRGVLIGQGISPVTATASGSAGQILRSGGAAADPAWSTATFPASVAANSILYGASANAVGALSTASTGALVSGITGVPSFAIGTTANRVLRTNGTTVSFAQVSLATDVTGTLPVANGGTGAATLTGFLYGNGTSAVTASTTIAGTAISGNISGNAANVTGTVAIANGGTGQTTKTTAYNALSPMTTLGDLVYRNATDAVRLPGNISTTKQFLSQTGTGSVSAVPVWSSITASDVTNAVINGGNTGAVTVGTNNATALTLETNGTPAVTVLSGGNVGIGTATPGQKLTVDGTIESTSGGIKFPDGTTQTTAATGGSGWPSTCPSGWTMIGSAGAIGTYCIESDERTAATFLNAKYTCGGLQPTGFGRAHVCSHDQWYTACQYGAGLSNMTNNEEWTSDVSNSGSNAALAAGSSGSCDSLNGVGYSATRNFRCCLP